MNQSNLRPVKPDLQATNGEAAMKGEQLQYVVASSVSQKTTAFEFHIWQLK